VANKKVLLITPPYHCGVVESAGRWPNLAFIYIAGELRKAGFDVAIYDAMSKFTGYDEIESEIDEFQPDFVGSTAITATLYAAVEVLKRAKRINNKIITLLGGVHPTFMWEEVLRDYHEDVDFCILGEGERTVPELLNVILKEGDVSKVQGIAYMEKGRAVNTQPREFIQDLDSIDGAWDIVDWNDYPLYFIDNSHVAIVSSSRGCIHECAFCSQHKFWQGSYRERDPVKFTNEIEYIHRRFGINVFFIADEYPTRNRERWDKILDGLIKKNLGIHILLETCVEDIIRDSDILSKYRKAGVLFIYVGVEATSQKRLDLFKKDIKFEQSKEAIRLIKEAGMICESSLILGMPDETKETIAETLQLAKLYDSDYMHFLMIAPWPYANIYKDLEPFIEIKDYSKYNLVYPIVKPKGMSRDDVLKEVLNCYRSYYMDKLPSWYWMTGNDLKRDCLLKGMKAIIENSFLKDHMKGLGNMPEELKRYIATTNAQEFAEERI